VVISLAAAAGLFTFSVGAPVHTQSPSQGSGQASPGNVTGQGSNTAPSGNGTGQAAGADVTACTAISDSQARLSCIAMWCGSENRDYTKCYGLADENDRLGCLNKCNPNQNN